MKLCSCSWFCIASIKTVILILAALELTPDPKSFPAYSFSFYVNLAVFQVCSTFSPASLLYLGCIYLNTLSACICNILTSTALMLSARGYICFSNLLFMAHSFYQISPELGLELLPHSADLTMYIGFWEASDGNVFVCLNFVKSEMTISVNKGQYSSICCSISCNMTN